MHTVAAFFAQVFSTFSCIDGVTCGVSFYIACMPAANLIRFFAATAVFASAAVLSLQATAREFPDKPIHFVVPYPAGGTADVLARLIATRLGDRLGKPVVVDNRAGAGAAIGAKIVSKSAPDGYTLLLGTVSSHAMNPAVNRSVGYDPISDFTPVTRVASVPFVLLESKSVPAKSFAELVALAKARPGKLTYGSAGTGTSNHLAGALFERAAGVSLLHVPYKGSASALSDLIGGQVDLMFDLTVTAKAQVQAGTVRAIAVTSLHRSRLLPDVPTVAEAGLPGFNVSAWFGVFGPAGVPPEIVDKLNKNLVAILQSPDIRDKFAGQGVDTEWSTSAEFGSFVRGEYEKWSRVVERQRIAVN